MRNAITPRIAYYFPRTETGLQLHYRFYFDFYPGEPATPSDPWLITSHTIEARVYQQVTPTLQVRLLFRYYRQSHASFWCAAPTRPTTLPPDGVLRDGDRSALRLSATPRCTTPRIRSWARS